VKFRRILDIFQWQGLQKRFGCIFIIFTPENDSCFLWSSDALWKFCACKVYKESSGHILMIFASENEVVCCEVQMQFEIAPIARFKSVLGAFSQFLCQQWNCFLWDSDPFWKSSARKFYKKCSGRIFMIYVSQNVAVFCEVQMHFGWFPLARFTKKVLGAFSRFGILKRCCFLWSSDAFWKFFACKFYKKCSGHISMIYGFKNEAVCCEVQTHFVNDFKVLHDAKTGCYI